MPVRRIASINAGCEIKKRKFVSPSFHEASAGLVYWLQRTIGRG
jgi:hypothetical protein